jgi:hypothetical protein
MPLKDMTLGLEELMARRKVRRRHDVARENDAHAAGDQAADRFQTLQQDQLAFAQQRNPVANALDFREHMRKSG